MRTRSAVDTLPSAPPPFPATALADKARDWQSLGLRYACLRFTTESPEDCVQMLRAYQGEAVVAPENITRGLFYRGAE